MLRVTFAAGLGVLLSIQVALAQQVGDRVHITGCENGELVLPVVNLWDSPSMTRILGQVSGDGRADQGLKCQGAVVIVREVRQARGRTFVRVETVVESQIGWVTSLFIGRKFDVANCATHFAGYPEYIEKCKQG